MDGTTETIEQHSDQSPRDMPRRGVLCGLAVLSLGLPAGVSLAGCTTTTEPATGGDTGQPAPSASGGGADTGGGEPLVALDEIEVGGGKVIDSGDTPIIVVQPEEGNVKAYNASCTHQGTTVNPPEDGIMECPNHGSQFNVADGGVENGPASRPLEEISVTVKDGQVFKA